MNSFIKYFYDIDARDITYDNRYYSFKYNNNFYRLYMLDDYVNMDFLLYIDRQLLGHTLIDEIIINKDNQVISHYNDNDYILMKIYYNIDNKITLEEINYLANSLYSYNLNINWGLLWSKKIDYLEDLVSENGKKYPIIVDSFNYFVGMAENAISYYNEIDIPDSYQYVISHKYIKNNDITTLYNPLNIIFDYKVRDIAEYIKNCFFENNMDIYRELDDYLKRNNLTIIDIKMLVSRLLYPSFYFELYEDILVNNIDEKIIINITKRLSEYEKYLASIINYLRNIYDIPDIAWLNNTYKK